jgi:membrane protein required for colicin V production
MRATLSHKGRGESVRDRDKFNYQQPGSSTNLRHEKARPGFCMNSFDLVVALALIIAIVTGFNTGLLRSAVTILAYLVAMPIAVWAMSMVAPHLASNSSSPLSQNWVAFFGLFLIAGMALGKLARMALDEAMGPGAGIGDRLGGATLGAVRVGLVATSFVLIFDQLVPVNRQSGIPQRLAAASAVFRGRTKGLSVATP